MKKLLVSFCFLLLTSASGFTQETVFNVPSGDILDKGKVYGEFDATYQPSTDLATFTPRVVIGIGHRLEIGLNGNGFREPGQQSFTPTPTVKWKIYDGGENGWAFLAGDDLYIPVQNKTYDLGNYVYAEFVKTWKTKTRATAGAFYFTPDVVATGNRAGGQFAIEQPVGSRLTLAADWYTGATSVGYVTPGLVVKLTQKLTGYFSYQIGNYQVDQGNHQFLFELGWNFN